MLKSFFEFRIFSCSHSRHLVGTLLNKIFRLENSFPNLQCLLNFFWNFSCCWRFHWSFQIWVQTLTSHHFPRRKYIFVFMQTFFNTFKIALFEMSIFGLMFLYASFWHGFRQAMLLSNVDVNSNIAWNSIHTWNK